MTVEKSSCSVAVLVHSLKQMKHVNILIWSFSSQTDSKRFTLQSFNIHTKIETYTVKQPLAAICGSVLSRDTSTGGITLSLTTAASPDMLSGLTLKDP